MARAGGSAPQLTQKIGSEALGTFFATLVPTTVDVLYYGVPNSHVDFVSRWLARGFVTVVLIYALAQISGAHIDPAVTLAFLVRRDVGLGTALPYWLAQFAGAFAAAFLVQARWGSMVVLGASHPGRGEPPFTAFITEIVATFLVVIVILATAEQKATVGKQAALAVGFSVATCGFFAGPISGASMNPARSIAPQIVGGAYDLVWIYAAGPSAGAVLAALAAAMLLGRADEGEREAARGEGIPGKRE